MGAKESACPARPNTEVQWKTDQALRHLDHVMQEWASLRTHMCQLEVRLEQSGLLKNDPSAGPIVNARPVTTVQEDIERNFPIPRQLPKGEDEVQIEEPSSLEYRFTKLAQKQEQLEQKFDIAVRHLAKVEQSSASAQKTELPVVSPEPAASGGDATSIERYGEQAADAADEDEYALNTSVWDVPIVIGLPGTGFLGSVIVTAAVLLNCAMQLTLCMIINDVFTEPSIGSPDVVMMRRWRVFFGHSTELMNKLTMTPYVKGVCDGVGGVQMSSEAVHRLESINQYVPERWHYEAKEPIIGPMLPYTEHLGVGLSVIAVFIWMMNIAQAMLSTQAKFMAVAHFPRAAKSRIDNATGGLKCITTGRKFGMIATCLLEVIVQVSLGVAGTSYIVRTLSLRDMLLNCSALAVVLDCDELLYVALVPRRTKLLLESIRAMARPLPLHVSGVSFSTVYSVLLSGVGVTFAIITLLEQQKTLVDVRNEICGGNLDFIARPDAAGIVTAGYNEREVTYADFEDTYAYAAHRQLIANVAGNVVQNRLDANDMSAASSGVDGGPWSLLGWTSTELDDVVDYWNSKCLDMLPIGNGAYDYASHFLRLLRDTSGDQSIRDCISIKKMCNNDDMKGVLAREICPVTCGCNKPGADIIVLGKNKGCSPSCFGFKSGVFNRTFWERPCQDLEKGNSYWSRYAEGVISYLSSYAGIGGFDPDAEALNIETHGCDLVSKNMPVSVLGITWINPCVPGNPKLQPFTFACPVSCGCSGQNPLYLCPPRCDETSDTYLSKILDAP